MRLLLSFLGLLLFSCSAFGQQRVRLSRAELKDFLTRTLQKPVEQRGVGQPVIRNEHTAIAIAEALAFGTYGEKQIRSEKPYQAALIDDYWVIMGSLPVGYTGGVFEVILDAKDGRVLHLMHGQ